MSSTGGKVRTGVTGDEVGVIGEGVGGVTGEGVGDVMGCCCGDDAGTGAFVGGSSVGSVPGMEVVGGAVGGTLFAGESTVGAAAGACAGSLGERGPKPPRSPSVSWLLLELRSRRMYPTVKPTIVATSRGPIMQPMI